MTEIKVELWKQRRGEKSTYEVDIKERENEEKIRDGKKEMKCEKRSQRQAKWKHI